LVFPHHENEVAQSEAHTHKPFANYWMHNGMLTMASGQKMGKSLGNVWNVQNALKEFPAEAIRLYYLGALYRSPLPWGEDALPEAMGGLCRLYDAREVAEAMSGKGNPTAVAQDLGEDAKRVLSLSAAFEDNFLGALDEDFNTAKAMAYVFELVRAINRFSNHKKAKKRGGPVVAGALAALDLVSAALGVLSMDVESYQEEVKNKRCCAMGLTRESVEEQISERTQARADKDWAKSDTIRDALDAAGVVLMDCTEGTSWRLRICDTQ
jgi:cysteinyl-tRNA synthetase